MNSNPQVKFDQFEARLKQAILAVPRILALILKSPRQALCQHQRIDYLELSLTYVLVQTFFSVIGYLAFPPWAVIPGALPAVVFSPISHLLTLIMTTAISYFLIILLGLGGDRDLPRVFEATGVALLLTAPLTLLALLPVQFVNFDVSLTWVSTAASWISTLALLYIALKHRLTSLIDLDEK